MKNILIVLVLLSVFLPVSANAATYYVDVTNGDNSYDGLYQTYSPPNHGPWQNISKVNEESFNSGDRILFKRGEIWSEDLIPPFSGSSGNPITFDAYGIGNRPQINMLNIVSKNYLTVNNIHFTATTSAAGIITGNTNTINIDNCLFDGDNQGNHHVCVLAGYNAANWVQNVNFTNCEFKDGGGGVCGLSIEEYSHDITVENCTAHDNPDVGLQSYTPYGPETGPYNIIYRNCEAYNNTSGASFDWHVHDSVMEFNKIYDNSNQGIYIEGTDNRVSYNLVYGTTQVGIKIAGSGTSNSKLYNNVVTGCSSRGVWYPAGLGGGHVFKNNIIYDAGWELDIEDTIDVTSDYNCFYAPGGIALFYNGIAYTSVSSWYSATGKDENSTDSNPSFIDAGNDDFRLQSNSPCIDAGIDVGLTQDFEGDTVPQGSAPDIGAYEMPVCEPNTYYVDATNGDDSNDGTCTNKAWKTIAKVNGWSFSPGDNILFKRGEMWSENLLPPSSGSSGNPIAFDAYGSGNKPQINRIYVASKNYLSFNNMHFIANGSAAGSITGNTNMINFNNCLFDGNNDGSLHVCVIAGYNAANWVQNVNFTNCEFKDSGGWVCGLSIEEYSRDITVKNCSFHDNTDNGLQAWTPYEASSAPYNLLFEGSEAYNNGNYGMGFSWGVHDSVLRYNKCYNNTVGFGGEAGANNEYYYNIAYGNSKGIEIDNIHEVATWYNNVIYDNSDYGIYIHSGASNGQLIKNNIFYGVSAANLIYVGGTVSITSDYNCFYDTGADKFHWHGTTYTSFADWQTNSGQDANSLNSDPQFVDASNENFSIEGTSPCIDAGTNVGLIQDFEGNPVPQGSAPDIGAYEYPSGESLLGPIALYHFDEGSGTTASDSSENGNGGTIYGATWTSDSISGNALKFDGSDDYISVPDSSSLDITDAITVEAWVKLASTSNFMLIVIKGGEGDYRLGYHYNGYFEFRLNYDTGTKKALNADGLTPVQNTWYHVVATYDKQKMKIYVNGTLINETDFSEDISTNNYALSIGYQPWSGNYFNGTIDEVGIYNRTLSEEEILEHYNEGIGAGPADLNDDGVVDIQDLITVTSHFGLTDSDPGWDETADVVEDGEIDIYDVVFVASRFT